VFPLKNQTQVTREKNHFLVDPICTSKISPTREWRWFKGIGSTLLWSGCHLSGMQQKLQKVFALWEDQSTRKRIMPELSVS
jgi:hypothetical protein